MEPNTRVVVTDIDMPFMSMVIFMVKWTVATIPAGLFIGAVLLILFLVGSALGLWL